MFKVEVIADSSGLWYGNAIRFSSEEDAKKYAQDLMFRWTSVMEWRVVKIEDPHQTLARS